MKSKILGLVAAGLLLGPMAASAEYLYTFADDMTSPTFSFSFSVNDFVTTTGSLAVTPLTAGSFLL